MISFPISKKDWTQTNTGEMLGDLFATRNISFDVAGYAKLTRRSVAIVSNLANTEHICAMATLNGVTYNMMSSASGNQNKSFSLSNATGTIADGATGSTKFDGLMWQGKWYVTQDTSFSNYNGSSWTGSLGSLTTDKYHPMCVHEGLGYLAIGDANTVKIYDTSHSLNKTVTLPANFEVIWIRYNNNNLYIGTRNIKGGEAMLFISDGTATTAQNGVVIPSSYYVFSGCIFKGVLVVITSRGQLLSFNGTGFDEIAHLPVYNTPYSWFYGVDIDTGKVAQRGMIAKGGRIYINLDGTISVPANKQLPNQPSGLWCYDPAVGLYHLAGLSNETIQEPSFSSADANNDWIITASYIAPTGTKVYINTTDIGGLVAKSFYYIISLNSTKFQLATSYTNAINGLYVDLTSNGSALDILIHADTCFGETASEQTGYSPGALIAIDQRDTSEANYKEYLNSQFLFGASTVNSVTGTSLYTIQSLCVGENRGSITTIKMTTTNVLDSWNRIIAKYEGLYQGNDKILIKYRTAPKENYPVRVNIDMTWTNATTFTSTFDFSQVAVGDEITFTSGRGAGCAVHIVSATNNAGTYTVVVDESIPGVVASDVSKYAVVDNWTKSSSATPSTQLPQRYLKGSTETASAKWLQVKIELRGVSEPYLEEVQIISERQQKGI